MNTQNKDTKYFRSLLFFFLFIFFFKFGGGLHYTLLAPLGGKILPLWLAGLLIGASGIIEMILDVPAGHWADRFGYANILRLGTLLFVLGAAALTFGLNTATFVITLILSTFGWLFFNPGSMAYMLSSVPKEIAGKSLGVFDAVKSAGIVLATIVLTIVINQAPVIIGITLSILLLFALAAAWKMPKETHSVHAEKKIKRHHYYVRRHFIAHLLRSIEKLNPASTLLLIQSLSASFFYATVWFVVPVLLARGSYAGLSGISLGVFDLSVTILGAYLGKMADKYDQRKTIFYGLLIFAFAATLIGFNLNIWFMLLGFLATAGDEMSGVSLWAWLDRLDTKHDEDGLISGAITFFDDIGWAVGPIAAGFLYSWFGPAWAIVVGALPIFIAWIMSVLMIRKIPKTLTLQQSGTNREGSLRKRHKD